MNNIKVLKEERNALYDQLDEIRSTADPAELGKVLDQIQSLNEQIDGGEKRDKGVKIEMESREQKQQNEEKRNFEQYLRGEERMATTSEGAAVIPQSVSDQLILQMAEVSPFFNQAKRFPSQSGSLKIAKEDSSAAGTFIGEGESLPEDTLSLGYAELTQKRVGAAQPLSNQLINDSAIDIVGYTVERLSRKIAKAAEQSGLVGNGGTQFNGITNDPDIETVTVSSAATMDDMVDLMTSIHPEYLDGAGYFVSRPFFNEISKWKDGNSHFYVQNGVVNGRPTFTLLGMPVYVSDALTASTPAVFANVTASYAILVKDGINIKQIVDSENALRGSQLLVADAYLDGNVYNSQAAAKLVVA